MRLFWRVGADMSSNSIQINLDRRTVQVLGFVLAVAGALYLVNHNPLDKGGATPNASASASGFPSSIATQAFGPQIVTRDELLAKAKSFGLATYWNGQMVGTQIELTITTQGQFYVRYLPEGVEVGSKDKYFTVASLYDANAYINVQNLAAQPGAKWRTYQTGATAAAASATDENIYFAYDGYPILVDVFTTNPDEGWALVDAGAIKILQ
jgi:hypothetical protein